MFAIGSSMCVSEFMDKQITDLSNSQGKFDAIDVMGPQEDHMSSPKKEEILPSYDFQPIRPIGASHQSNPDNNTAGGSKVWNSADSKPTAAIGGKGVRDYSSLDSIEPATVTVENSPHAFDTALLPEIDRTMKKHADGLLHALEGFSAQLSQLESRTRNLEHSMDNLKGSIGNYHGSTDGKLRQLENVFTEVQSGVQIIRDKQDVIEAQLQQAKLQVSKVELPLESQNADSQQAAASALQPSYQQLPPAAIIQPSLTLPPANAPPPPASHQHQHQHLPPSVQHPSQFDHKQVPSLPQRELFFPSPSQAPEPSNPQYQLPPPQQLQPLFPAPPQQPHQPPPPPPYPQPPLPPQQHQPLPALNSSQPQPQSQPFLGHHLAEASYPSPQSYPPNLQQPPHPPNGTPPQQFYGVPSSMYEPPSSGPSSAFSTPYGPSGEPYPYSGSPSKYGSNSMKQQQLSSQSGGSSYPQLPTARMLPQVPPTASGVSGGSGSPGTGNRVPIDDVVDKVTSMGFPRDQVKATVRRLTENRQPVDLNIVLDKLMNDGEGQPPRGWFGQ